MLEEKLLNYRSMETDEKNMAIIGSTFFYKNEYGKTMVPLVGKNSVYYYRDKDGTDKGRISMFLGGLSKELVPEEILGKEIRNLGGVFYDFKDSKFSEYEVKNICREISNLSKVGKGNTDPIKQLKGRLSALKDKYLREERVNLLLKEIRSGQENGHCGVSEEVAC